MEQGSGETVFQAPVNSRIGAIVGSVILVLLASRLVFAYGWLASIAALFAAGVIFNLWYILLRPRLVARPDGVEIVNKWQPVRIPWKDVQRCEVGPKGTIIVSRGGSETPSRFPAGDRAKTATDPQTEADRAAIFLAACVAWGRKGGDEPMPNYVPPPKPSK